MTVIIHGAGEEHKDRTIILDLSTLTTKAATQREAEASYVAAIVRGHRQCAYELTERASEAWSRETRQEERRGG